MNPFPPKYHLDLVKTSSFLGQFLFHTKNSRFRTNHIHIFSSHIYIYSYIFSQTCHMYKLHIYTIFAPHRALSSLNVFNIHHLLYIFLLCYSFEREWSTVNHKYLLDNSFRFLVDIDQVILVKTHLLFSNARFFFADKELL